MNYRFQNLLGAPYRGGNTVITSNTTLISPISNRISLTNLLKSHSQTLPFQSSSNISRLAVSPCGTFLLTVDNNNRAHFVNLPRRIVLHRITFNKGGSVKVVKFSPDGRFIAVGVGKLVQIWRSPGFEKRFCAFELVRTFEKRFCAFMFLGHRDVIVGAFFGVDKSTNKVNHVYTLSRDGAVFGWSFSKNEEPGTPEQESEENRNVKKRKTLEEDVSAGLLDDVKWELVKKDFFMQAPAKLTACDYHKGLELLVAGFSSGVFGLYQMPDFVCIHLLSISREKITTATFNELGN